MKMVDYRNLRFNNLNTPQFKHLWLLLFWPIHGLIFAILERFTHLEYTAIHCALDDKIPFCEYFIIPYYFWFVFLIGMIAYSLLFDIPTFKKYMWFTIITYTVTCVIYAIYPNMQELRPVVFERNNVFTAIVKLMYGFDTNTNVCPSLHVIGSFAVLFASWNSKLFGKTRWRVTFSVITVLICLSTVFLKQHSVIDIVAGLALSFVVMPFVFIIKWNHKKPSEPVPEIVTAAELLPKIKKEKEKATIK